ncbi:MAG: DUF2256 domain-containing protein [Burkholderiaceae bacterium]|nr:DUF2256 domain-containing protein [Burkholderiaceae bacterium]
MAFKGNKAALPTKPCAACGRPMSWRKRWAKTWDSVRYCSDRCRQARTAAPGSDGLAGPDAATTHAGPSDRA